MAQTTATENLAAEVLTLAEAAGYLRISEEEVIEIALRHGLPGRKIGKQWRFLKQGLAEWLLESSGTSRLLRHAGALKDDPDLEPMLKRISEERGRSLTEDVE